MAHASKTLIAATLIAACLVAPAAAGATAPHRCRSADLRYPAALFAPHGPLIFGVFGLRIAHGSCANAHRVAQAWMSRFESAFRAGRTVLPRSVDGFSFTSLPVHAAQTFRERGRRRATTIWFEYRIPNG